MRLTICSTILLVLTAGTFISNDRSSRFDGPPVIERFEAVPDCIYPDPRRGILSYLVTNVVRLRTMLFIEAGASVRFIPLAVARYGHRCRQRMSWILSRKTTSKHMY